MKLKKFFKYIWAAPLTVVGLAYVFVLNFFGWYRWWGCHGDALVWVVDSHNSPLWLLKIWKRWTGHVWGQVIVLRHNPTEDNGPTVLKHELEHVRQQLRLGIFHPLIYWISSFGIWAAKSGHPYYDNPFEIAARRSAKQYIDMTGLMSKVREKVLRLH